MKYPASLTLSGLLVLASLPCVTASAKGPNEPPRPAFENVTPNPGAPVPDTAAAAKRIKDLGKGEFELGTITFNSATREVRVPCKVNMTKGLVEYALVHEMGKTHESILKTSIAALDLQLALLLTNYEAGHTGLFESVKDPAERKKMEPTAPKTPGGNLVQLSVEWKKDGETKRASLIDWMIDTRTKKAPTTFNHWVFNGSMIQQSGFSAQLYGNIIGVYYDATSIINCPSKDNDSDDIWSINTNVVPKEDSDVTLVITPFKQPAHS